MMVTENQYLRRHRKGISKIRKPLSFSLLLHLTFFSLASVLSSDLKMNVLPMLELEVFLQPLRPAEKPPMITLRKEKKEAAPLSRSTNEVEEYVVSKALPLTEAPDLPEAPPLLVEEKKEEIKDEVAQGEKKPFPMTPVNREMVLGTWREDFPELPSSLTQSPSPGGEEVIPNAPVTQKVCLPPAFEEVVIVHPRYAETPKPPYPQEAQRKGVQGEVVLKVEVLSNGLVGQVEIKKSSGHEILDRSALSAVKKWKFIPARMGESTISAWVNIPIKFQLR